MTSDPPVCGSIYQHYKGGRYLVIEIAKHTETGEQMVVYLNVEHFSAWVRPLSEWTKPVDGRQDTKRFALKAE